MKIESNNMKDIMQKEYRTQKHLDFLRMEELLRSKRSNFFYELICLLPQRI